MNERSRSDTVREIIKQDVRVDIDRRFRAIAVAATPAATRTTRLRFENTVFKS
jgi:hypothetical protein